MFPVLASIPQKYPKFRYLDDCGDEGALVVLLALTSLTLLRPLPAAGVCAHLGIIAAIRVHLWFAAIDLFATHPPHAVRAMLWFAAIEP